MGIAQKLIDRLRQNGPIDLARYAALRLRHAAHSRLYDARFTALEAVPTAGTHVPADTEIAGRFDHPDDKIYEGIPRLVLTWSIEALAIDPADFTFVDIGSGRGRALMTAAAFPFRRVVGVEFAQSLHEDALANIAAWPRERLACRDIASHHSNALDWPLPTGNLVIFAFNPFRGAMLDALAQRIVAAKDAENHTIKLIFANSERLPLFTNEPRIQPIKPRGAARLKLALFGTVPMEFFEVR